MATKKTYIIIPTITTPTISSDTAPTVVTKNNKKYLNVPYFYSEKEK